MKRQLFPAVVLFFVPFLFSCSTPAGPEGNKPEEDSIVMTRAPRRDLKTDCRQLRREARRMDSTLLKQTEIDKNLGIKAIKAFTRLAYECPDDSVSPIYLIKAAQVAQAIRNVPQAKTALDKCIADYPNFKDRPAALFLLAQLYDETTYLNNELEAKKLYQKIIDEYPKSPWADNAKGALKFIGKSDKQIIEELEKKQKK